MVRFGKALVGTVALCWYRSAASINSFRCDHNAPLMCVCECVNIFIYIHTGPQWDNCGLVNSQSCPWLDAKVSSAIPTVVQPNDSTVIDVTTFFSINVNNHGLLLVGLLLKSLQWSVAEGRFRHSVTEYLHSSDYHACI